MERNNQELENISEQNEKTKITECIICNEYKQRIIECTNCHVICYNCYDGLSYKVRFNEKKYCRECYSFYLIPKVRRTIGIGNILNKRNIFRFLDELDFEKISENCSIPPKYVYKLIYSMIKLLSRPTELEYPVCVFEYVFMELDSKNQSRWIQSLRNSIKNFINRIIHCRQESLFCKNPYEAFIISYTIKFRILLKSDAKLEKNSKIYSKLSPKCKVETEDQKGGDYDLAINDCLSHKMQDDNISKLYDLNAEMSKQKWTRFVKACEDNDIVFLHPADWSLNFKFD